MNSLLSPAIPTPFSARQRGDFQTPEVLAREVWTACASFQPDLVIEPTFGLGSFLATMPHELKARVLGWEIHSEYHSFTSRETASLHQTRRIQLIHGDVFAACNSDLDLKLDNSVLVIGNPPWVTNSEQGFLGGGNTGDKRNLKSLSGLDAMTGKANFDISEAIIIHFVCLLRGRCRKARFALLTKFSVARNLLEFLSTDSQTGDFEFHKIDSMKHFGAAVDAGLLRFTLGADVSYRSRCPIFDGIEGDEIGQIGLVGKRLIYDLKAYECTAFMENHGRSHYAWRQGVKHDLSKVMELRKTETGFENGLGEVVDVEDEVLYDLYKSSDLFNNRLARFVTPVYQQDLKDSLEALPQKFPKLFCYLTRHQTAFKNRKSSIYRNKPMFSIFGIGDYTHFTYKVAISGLYTLPVFRLLEPTSRPVIVDDTAYIIATNNLSEAVYLYALLSLKCTQDFLLAISHAGDKRRFGKSVLSRVLLPAASQCPAPLMASIIEAWAENRTIPIEIHSQLQRWLQTYQSNN